MANVKLAAAVAMAPNYDDTEAFIRFLQRDGGCLRSENPRAGRTRTRPPSLDGVQPSAGSRRGVLAGHTCPFPPAINYSPRRSARPATAGEGPLRIPSLGAPFPPAAVVRSSFRSFLLSQPFLRSALAVHSAM